MMATRRSRELSMHLLAFLEEQAFWVTRGRHKEIDSSGLRGPPLTVTRQWPGVRGERRLPAASARPPRSVVLPLTLAPSEHGNDFSSLGTFGNEARMVPSKHAVLGGPWQCVVFI